MLCITATNTSNTIRTRFDASSTQLHNPIPAYTLFSHLNEILL